MSNDLPDKKKGLFSGLGNPSKAKDQGPSVPGQEAANPSVPPASGKAQHFRSEFEVFRSGKESRKQDRQVVDSAKAPRAPRSGKNPIAKSADLSKEFEFFNKPSKPAARGPAGSPAQGVTAKPPVISAQTQSDKAATPPPPPILRSPAPLLKKDEVPVVPPPPPKIEKKTVVPEAGKGATIPVPPVSLPQPATAAKAPSPPSSQPPALEKKPESGSPAKASSAAPADIFAPKKKPVVPEIPVPAKKEEVQKPPAPSQAVLPEKEQSVAKVAPTPPVSAAVPVSAPISGAQVAAGAGAVAKKTIKKVELDPGRRKRPAVVLPPVEEAGFKGFDLPPSSTEGKKKRPLLAWLSVAAMLLLLGGIGFYVYQITRETFVEVVLSTEDIGMAGTPMVVYNFDGQVSQIKRDYSERRSPMEGRLQEIEADLAAAKADLAGREEKKRLLTGEIQKLRDSIPVLMSETEKKLDKLWKEEGGNLDKSYADQKEALHKEIEKRARDLGLKYERNQELDALEVAVNAFRLSLYGAAKTVNVDEQRVFSEDLLKRWRDFEKDWSQKQLEIKEKAMAIKQSPGPKITDTEKAIETLKVDLDALNIDLASLQEEVARRQQDEVEEQEKLREVEKPFLSDLMKIPGNNMLRELKADQEGRYRLSNLEDSTDMPPGEYLLFVQGRKDDEIFWATKPFTVSKHKKTEIQVSRQDFVAIRKLIQ